MCLPHLTHFFFVRQLNLCEDLLSRGSMTQKKGRPQLNVRVNNLRENWCEGLLRHELGMCSSFFLFVHLLPSSFWSSHLLRHYCVFCPSVSMPQAGACLLTLTKGSRLSKPSAWGNFSVSHTWSTKTMTGCRARSTFMWVHRNLFWQLSRDRNLHGLGMSHHNSLSKTILWGTLDGGWCCGWQRNCWMDNIKEWTSLPVPELLTRASCRKYWKRIHAESSLMSFWQPNQSRDWTELFGERVCSTGDTCDVHLCDIICILLTVVDWLNCKQW